MKMEKAAALFKKKLATSWQNTYKSLIDLLGEGKSLSIDVYDEKEPAVVSALNEIATMIATAASLAYNKGITAPELMYYVNKAKNKAIMTLSLGDQLDEGTKAELSAFYNKLNSFVALDIPSQKPAEQKPAPAVPSANKYREMISQDEEVDMPARAMDVATDLARKEYPSESESMTPSKIL
jgi:hypothetical protein